MLSRHWRDGLELFEGMGERKENGHIKTAARLSLGIPEIQLQDRALDPALGNEVSYGPHRGWDESLGKV